MGTISQEPESVAWERVSLSSFYNVKYGRANPGRTGSIPVVGSSGIYAWTDTPLIQHPTIVIGRKGSAGQAWLVEQPSHPSDTTFYLEPKDSIHSHIKFIYYALRYFQLAATEDVIPSLQRHELENMILPLPPLPEQRAIAAVLSKVQAAGEVQEKIVATLKELKAATMAKLFREGLRGEPLKQTEIGEIPESWEMVRVGDGCSYTTGKLNSERAVEHGEYPFFTCSQETFRIDSFSFDQEALLLAGNNAQGKYSVKYYKGKFDAYQRTYVISVKDTLQLNYQFLFYELTRKLESLRRNSLGATTKYLTASVISNLQISKPCLEEQKQFANILSAIDEKIGKEEKHRATLKSLFSSMLHLLMTGQVRVNLVAPTLGANL